ncbi:MULTISPECIES: hypothetical protein [Lactobacillus]|nr:MULTISPECIES: hypothetical protein [Lactobacillus]OXC28242.1 hypothetical protein AYP83_01865 [Lactobacillus crispatus]OXC36297.1 hypothetical protein AYP90_09475 [Lactobacillus crispatus]UNL59420.1 hypothetical protein G8B18_01315 [Lactobacillus johnsonii]
MTKLKIAYDKNYLSAEQLQKMNLNSSLVDIQGKNLNSNQPQMAAFSTYTLLMIGKFTLIDILLPMITNLASSLLYDYWKNKAKKVDSSGNVEDLDASILLNGNVKLVVCEGAKLTENKWMNIYDSIRHLDEKKDYIFILNKDGRLKIYTTLEYAHKQHDKQN